MAGFNAPNFSPDKTGEPVTDRMFNRLASLLNPLFKNGANRIQGYDVPPPTAADDGKKLTWNQAARAFTWS